MKLNPSIVFMLEQSEQNTIHNLKFRRVDIVSGEEFNLQLVRPKEVNIIKSLVECKG